MRKQREDTPKEAGLVGWTVQDKTHTHVYKDGFILSASGGDNVKSNDISTIPLMIKRQHNAAIWHMFCLTQERRQKVLIAHFCILSASKFAVFGMTEALSEELHHLHKDGIKTTTVCPMFVDTGLTKYPQGRFGKILSPKEVALEAIDGALKDHVVVMVPRSIQVSVVLGQLFPYRFRRSLKEFMGFGILPQYESSKPSDNKHS